MIFPTARAPIRINMPTRAALFRTLRDRFARKQGFALATLNLDHLSRLPRDPAFATAYGRHDFVVADGRPVTWLCRIAGERTALLPGSDLVRPLCRLAAEEGVSVAMIGSSQSVLDRAAARLTAEVPGLKIGFIHAPPFGFEPEGDAAFALLRELAASGARLCFVALSAPRQEQLAARGRQVAPAVGFACIGAGLDFIAGHQHRAPRLMRLLALEWLWRLMLSPRRLGPRYARCFAILPGLMGRALRQRWQGRPGVSGTSGTR